MPWRRRRAAPGRRQTQGEKPGLQVPWGWTHQDDAPPSSSARGRGGDAASLPSGAPPEWWPERAPPQLSSEAEKSQRLSRPSRCPRTGAARDKGRGCVRRLGPSAASGGLEARPTMAHTGRRYVTRGRTRHASRENRPAGRGAGFTDGQRSHRPVKMARASPGGDRAPGGGTPGHAPNQVGQRA